MNGPGKSIVYRLHHSGVSNERMSLEIAVGLASLTQRKLILYGNSGDSFGLLPTFGGWYRMEDHGWFDSESQMPIYKPSLVTDLYESLPVELSVGRENKSIPQQYFSGVCDGVKVFNSQLNCCCYAPTLNEFDGSFAEAMEVSATKRFFSGGRCLLVDPSESVWRLEGPNLSYFSRFFYDPTGVISLAMRQMKLRRWIESFARHVSCGLGSYYGCHIRLTDFRKVMPQHSNYGEVVAQVLAGSIPKDQLLVVSTDEEAGGSFFDPIKKKFKNILFLDQYLRYECGEFWSSIPFVNESILGIICQLILQNSEIFMGTPGSTFSGMIHRGWLRERLDSGALLADSSFRYIHCGLLGAPASLPGYFEDGIFVEAGNGPFSWNKISLRGVLKGQLSWYREWPECASA